ncbi:hypothetical protein V7075_27540, partial [Neobacillus drentensis]|uniref:hypothetical protein n=1 Tax=Neobacillus drentensis TaxID=220684 RepID=UPI002FFD8C3F
ETFFSKFLVFTITFPSKYVIKSNAKIVTLLIFLKSLIIEDSIFDFPLLSNDNFILYIFGKFRNQKVR